ncbi:hypothetical protein ACFC00_40135 [Streptomyces adustus]|uniref:hypothetical protein n=1 Tax=Streptomyces adustus TaxID=1609272 RepID=UPI0035DC7D3C
MGCSCNNKKKDQFQVVTQGGSGRAVLTSSSKDTATSVSRKYPGSVVKDGQGNIVGGQASAAAGTQDHSKGHPNEKAP